jgi:hypothetical protein
VLDETLDALLDVFLHLFVSERGTPFAGAGLCCRYLARGRYSRHGEEARTTPPPSFDIYKVVARGRMDWRRRGPDKVAAIHEAAKEFKVAAWRLFAEQRR